MPSIGPIELAIVLAIALIIFGPRRLPGLGRSLGHGIRELRSTIACWATAPARSRSDATLTVVDAS